MNIDVSGLISGEHYLSVMLILVLSCTLMRRNTLPERIHQGSLWVTILVCALLLFQDVAERYAQLDPARRGLRITTSIIGYALRPAAVLGFLLVVWPASLPRWYLWIPAVLNAMLYSTALFDPIAFSFDEDYVFRRGPLGSVMFFVCLAYLIVTLFMVHRSFRERKAGDNLVIDLCAVGCLGATVADILLDSITVVPAILISSMTFYLFLRTAYMDHDPLTRLWNRMTFYEDCRKLRKTISAVASIDMNGLKKINDDLGHEAGDRALRTFSRALHEGASRKVIPYRTGGDEFMILFTHCNEEEIRQTLISMMDRVAEAGLTVSVGLASLDEVNGSLEDMIHLSDRRMYEDKSRYYQLHDRRKNRSR